jgi:hypothetical protein
MALVTIEDLGNLKIVSTVKDSTRVIVLSGRLPGPDGYYRAVRIEDNGGGFYRVVFIRRGEVRSLSMYWLDLLGAFASIPNVVPILWDFLRS